MYILCVKYFNLRYTEDIIVENKGIVVTQTEIEMIRTFTDS